MCATLGLLWEKDKNILLTNDLNYKRKLCHFVHEYPSYPLKIKYFVYDIELKAPHA